MFAKHSEYTVYSHFLCCIVQHLMTSCASCCMHICDRASHSRVCLPVTPPHSARKSQDPKIFHLVGHTCTHRAVNVASCCCRSGFISTDVFFFTPRVAMKKHTRAGLVLFPLCHASFVELLHLSNEATKSFLKKVHECLRAIPLTATPEFTR